MRTDRRFWAVLLLAILAVMISACSSSSTPEATPTITVTSGPTNTPAPTPTPTPAPPLAVLLAPTGADEELVAALQSQLKLLAEQSGLRFETRPALAAGDLGPELRVVVAVPPDSGISALAASAPGTQFLALDIPDLPEAANLSTIGADDAQPDQMGFIAGYLAAVITNDWRTGTIVTGDAAGQTASQGFRNGVVFFCGLCRPTYPPFYEYPVLETGQTAADSLISQGVQTAYLAPGADDPAVLEYLAQSGLNLIGSSPPPENLKPNWIATIQTDLLAGVEQLWSSLVNGQGGFILSTPIVITDRNEALFSPGRQRLVDETLAALLSGQIASGVGLLTP